MQSADQSGCRTVRLLGGPERSLSRVGEKRGEGGRERERERERRTDYFLSSCSLFFSTAEVSQELGDTKGAIENYGYALKKKRSFVAARIALAKLYLQEGNLSACDQECVSLLSVDQDNEEATLVSLSLSLSLSSLSISFITFFMQMRADLLFHRGYEFFQEAIHHLQELLMRKPGQKTIP